jgi:hypothetical protein
MHFAFFNALSFLNSTSFKVGVLVSSIFHSLMHASFWEIHDEWEDEDAIPSLFSQHLSIEKITLWEKIITSSCHFLHRASFTEAELRNRFTRGGLQPMGLTGVLVLIS